MTNLPQYLQNIIQIMGKNNIRSITVVEEDGTERSLENISMMDNETYAEYIQLALFEDRLN